MLEHVRKHQEQINKSITNSIGGQALSEEQLEKGATEYFEKAGRKATVGETREFGGRAYIKTAQGWKFHGKGTSKKVVEHKEGALQHHVDQDYDKDYYSSKKEQDFHEGYNHRNSQLKGNKEKDKKGNEHFEAGKRYAEEHHKEGRSDVPATAYEHYDESGEKSYMELVGGDNKWSYKKQAVHLARHLGQTELANHMENDNSSARSDHFRTRLEGLKRLYDEKNTQ